MRLKSNGKNSNDKDYIDEEDSPVCKDCLKGAKVKYY